MPAGICLSPRALTEVNSEFTYVNARSNSNTDVNVSVLDFKLPANPPNENSPSKSATWKAEQDAHILKLQSEFAPYAGSDTFRYVMADFQSTNVISLHI